jgi:CheY-like chemotaxis protein
MLSVPDSTRGPLPLLIGVTGHRDLRPADCPVLERTVRRAIQQIREQCPHTPLIVLSALAEGADRLVARAALDLGLSLIVPSPMPQAEYEKDFDKPGSLDDSRSLLGQAKWQFVVAEDENVDLTGLEGDARSQRYALVGAFIAQSG